MVELPHFVGMDCIGWIGSAERFFGEQEIQLCNELQWEFMSMKSAVKPHFGVSVMVLK